MAASTGPTLHCRIELNKGNGITVTVEDEQGGITQTIELDGKVIKTTCKGKEDTSTITQAPDSIAIKCKTFTLDAETVTVTSEKETLHQSKDVFDIKATKALTIKGEDAVTCEATKDLTLKGQNLAASATQKASMKGADAEVTGQNSGKLTANDTKVTGNLSAEVKGGTSAKVASDATLDLQGQMTNVKGQMISVSGTLVKLG